MPALRRIIELRPGRKLVVARVRAGARISIQSGYQRFDIPPGKLDEVIAALDLVRADLRGERQTHLPMPGVRPTLESSSSNGRAVPDGFSFPEEKPAPIASAQEHMRLARDEKERAAP